MGIQYVTVKVDTSGLYQPLSSAVGVVGLGTGTIAVYGRPGDSFRFYDINPAVIDVA